MQMGNLPLARLDNALAPEPPDEFVFEADVFAQKVDNLRTREAHVLARLSGEVVHAFEPERAHAIVVEKLQARRGFPFRVNLVKRLDTNHHPLALPVRVAMDLRLKLVVERLLVSVLRHLANTEPGAGTGLQDNGRNKEDSEQESSKDARRTHGIEEA